MRGSLEAPTDRRWPRLGSGPAPGAVAVAVETADAEDRALDDDDAVCLVTTEPRRYRTPTLDGLTIIPIGG